jgi:hypothetical protein
MLGARTRGRQRRRLAALLALAALALAGCGDGATRAEAQFRFFASSSPWNRRASIFQLDPRSGPITRNLAAEVKAEKLAERGPSINTVRWSVPIYRVAADQPTVRVLQDTGSAPSLQEAWDAVPLPANAVAAAGTDKHLVVWQPSTDKLWEFFHLRGGPGDWRARWGGAIENVSESSGVYGPEAWLGAGYSWGASASSLSLAGGLITLEDLERGYINHALALALPEIRAGVYAAPAQRTDGETHNSLALPEGARLRLDPTLNLGSLHLPHFTKMLAEAAQRYGIIVRSRAGVVAFFGQDPTPTGSEPYEGPNGAGFFEGRNRLELLGAFPWSHLQLLKMQLHQQS